MAIHPLIKVMTPIVGAAIAGRIAQDPELRRKISDSFSYGSYLGRHKWNVIGPMRSMGLGYGQALKHDLSKVTPSEFGPYRDWFEGPGGIKGTRDPRTYETWRRAVQHHYTTADNLHHLRPLKLNPEQVPLKYRMEAVADWYSVGKTKGRIQQDFSDWYKEHRAKLPIDSQAKSMIDLQLGISKKAELILNKLYGSNTLL